MLQYLLTGVAGLALGIVIMRVWQAREGSAAMPAEGEAATPDKPKTASTRTLLLGAGGMAALAAAVLVLRPSGDAASTAVVAPVPGQAGASPSLDDVDTAIQRLAERLKTDANDGEGFRMLGWSYVMTGHPDKAIEPYKRALQLLPNNPTVHAGYAEALTGVAEGKVTQQAKAEADKALSLDKNEPRARYFAALWLAQNGKPTDALDQWVALVNSGPADAPWQADVRKQVAETSAKLGIDVTARLKPAAAIAAAPAAAATPGVVAAGQTPPSVDQMIGGLANKLAANPRDPAGWAMLVRSRMVLHQADQAAKDLATARKALASDPAGLAEVNTAAQAAGVPGA
jgi:cytochrome c-type biogenesis protein CcmH